MIPVIPILMNDFLFGLVSERVKGKVPCDVCGKCFSSKSNLKTHMKLHTGVKEYQCSICMKEFTQKVTLQGHMLTHMSNTVM